MLFIINLIKKSYIFQSFYKYKQYILEDKGYDSSKIKQKHIENGYKVLISPNRRNTKDKNKLNILSKKDKFKFKKRIKVENFFSWLKMYPKINFLYEKTYAAFENIVYFVSAIILYNRINSH